MYTLNGMDSLVNPQAIQLTKANAYKAAQIVLGTSASQAQLIRTANDYTNSVIPKLNRAASVGQIVGDPDFATFASRAKDSLDASPSEKIAKVEKEMKGVMDPSGTTFGVPNLIVYGGVAAAGYWYWKKRKKSTAAPAPASAI